MYSGIPSVVDFLLELKPEMLPELVDKVQNRLLQSFAASCLAGIRATSRLPPTSKLDCRYLINGVDRVGNSPHIGNHPRKRNCIQNVTELRCR